MSQEVVDKVRGAGRVIVVNDQYKLAPWADALYACDGKWWKVHTEALKFQGWKVCLSVEKRSCEYDEVYSLICSGHEGFDDRPTHIRSCKNSGYQAMHLAAHFGVRRIVLLGFDMRKVRGDDHWFGDHPTPLKCPPPYSLFLKLISISAKEFKNREIEVLNCTPNSALRCFTQADLEKVIESVRSDSNNAAVSA